MCIDVAAGLVIAHGISDIRSWGYALATFAADCSIHPLSIQVVVFLMSKSLHLSGLREFLWISFGTFCTIAISLTIDTVNFMLLSKAEDSTIFMYLFVFCSGSIIASSGAFECKRRRRISNLCAALDSCTHAARKTGVFQGHGSISPQKASDTIGSLFGSSALAESEHDSKASHRPLPTIDQSDSVGSFGGRSSGSTGSAILAERTLDSTGTGVLAERARDDLVSMMPRELIEI